MIAKLRHLKNPRQVADDLLNRFDVNATYTTATVDYLLSGGDGYTTFTEGKNVKFGLKDIDALTAYIGDLSRSR